MMRASLRFVAVIAGMAALAGCKSKGDIVVNEGIGITAVRTACPATGIPDYTGDITLFSGPGAQTASALDLTASITNLQTSCNEAGTADIFSEVSFDVFARRTDVREARSVSLPYFAVVVRGGSAVVSKQIGSVTLNFAPGQERTQARGKAGAVIERAEATLPADIRNQITKRRKSGDADAAIDPLSLPEVRAAVARATFELLVGFQLSDDQLAYNATR